MDTGGGDPFDWSIEEVVANLCSPNGLLQTQFSPFCPNLTDLARNLKENDISGEFLLTEVSDSHLKEDFNIKSIGQRVSINRTIQALRKRSAKFVEHERGHQGLQRASSLRSVTPSMAWQTPAFLPSTMERFVREPVPTPERQASSASDHLHPNGRASGTDENEVPQVRILASGEKPPRSKELYVEDGRGGKRRKLMPEALEPAEQSEDPYFTNIRAVGASDTDLTDATQNKELLPAESSTNNSASIVQAKDSFSSSNKDRYIGTHAMPVNDVFFGQTEIGQEIHHSVWLKPVERNLIQKLDDIRHLPEGPLVVYRIPPQCIRPSTTQRLYVNKRLKFYLLSSNAKSPLLFGRKGRVSPGIIPYPEKLLRHVKGKVKASATIISKNHAIRADRRDWKQLDTVNDMMRAHLTDDPNGQFAYLDRWLVQEDKSEVLPVLGESDSDEVYDSDTWNEMEEEIKELETKAVSGETKVLTRAVVLETIESSIAEFLKQWKIDKLPRLEATGWRKWTRSRKQGTWKLDIEACEETVNRLDRRLQRLKKDMTDVLWSTHKQLQKQCISLHESLSDKETSSWLANLYRQKSPPARPTSSSRNAILKKPRTRPEDLEDDEEELTSNEGLTDSEDGTNDFIVHGITNGLVETFDRGNDDESQAVQLPPDNTLVDQPNLPLSDHAMVSDDTSNTKLNDNNHHAKPRKNVFDIESSSDIDVTEQSPLRDKSEQTQSPDSLMGDMLPPAMLSPVKLATPIFEDGCQQLIDLSQESDPETEPLKPNETATQSLIKADHHSLSGSSSVPEAEAEQSVGVEPAVEDLGSGLPQMEEVVLNDIPLITTLGDTMKDIWAERKDRRRLLTWIVGLSKPKRTIVSLVSKGKGEDLMMLEVWEGLKAFKARSLKIKGRSEQHSDGLLHMATWYIIWITCVIPDPEIGMDLADVKAAWESSEGGFREFYLFLLEQLLWHDTHTIEQSEPHHGTASFPFKKREQQPGGVLPEESRASSVWKRKSTKKIPHESQEGIDLRSGAQARAKEREMRSRELHMELQAMGGSDQLGVGAIVNPVKSEDEDFITVNPHIGAWIQPHQLEGVRFMWSEVVGAKEGCLLAHTMGLGKTMQCITLLVTIAEASKHPSIRVHGQIPEHLRQSRTIILCPPSLIDNWYDELLKWVPTSAKDSVGDIKVITSGLTPGERMFELQEWDNDGGILLLPYSLLTRFVLNMKSGKEMDAAQLDQEQELASRIILESPSIVIADEAQTFKTSSTKTSDAMHRFRSRSRIALTGSPLSNNLEEYFSLVNWVQENYLGDKREFKEKFVFPITEGLFQNSTQYKKRQSLTKLSVLKTDLAPKVHRADFSVMKGQMKGKTEFIVRLAPTTIQEKCYKIYLDSVIQTGLEDLPLANLWTWLAILRLLCSHPACFYEKLTGRETKHGKALGNSLKKTLKTKQEEKARFEDVLDLEADELLEKPVTAVGLDPEMVKNQLEALKEAPNIYATSLSRKMEVLMGILHYAKESREKALVFSQSLVILNYVETRLKKIGRNFLRLDGASKTSGRQQLTKDFNMGTIDILLISTRAGGTGLNLQAASRVVILDDSFNPMWEQQAIGRAYRIGQQKHVYVYRLLLSGSFEEAVQNQALFKLQLSTRVVDKKDTVRLANKDVKKYLCPLKPQAQQDLALFRGKDPLVMDRVLDRQSGSDCVRSIQLAETFLEEEKEELTAEEQRQVDEDVELRRLRRSDPDAYEARLREIGPRGLMEAPENASLPLLNMSTNVPRLGTDMTSSHQGQLSPGPEPANISSSASLTRPPLTADFLVGSAPTPGSVPQHLLPASGGITAWYGGTGSPKLQSSSELVEDTARKANVLPQPTSTEALQDDVSVDPEAFPLSAAQSQQQVTTKANDALRSISASAREQSQEIFREIARKKMEGESTDVELNDLIATIPAKSIMRIMEVAESKIYESPIVKSETNYNSQIRAMASLLRRDFFFHNALKKFKKAEGSGSSPATPDSRSRASPFAVPIDESDNAPTPSARGTPRRSPAAPTTLRNLSTPSDRGTPRRSPAAPTALRNVSAPSDRGTPRRSPAASATSPNRAPANLDGAFDASDAVQPDSPKDQQGSLELAAEAGEQRVGPPSSSSMRSVQQTSSSRSRRTPFTSSVSENFPALRELLLKNTADRRR